MTRFAWLLALLVAVAVWSAPVRSWACKCAGPLGEVHRPSLPGAPLVLVKEDIRVRCQGEAPMLCAWRSVHRYRGTAASAAGVAMIAGEQTPTSSGVLALGLPDGKRVELADAPTPFTIAVTGGAEFELVLEGVLKIPRNECTCHPDGIRARHLLVSRPRTRVDTELMFVTHDDPAEVPGLRTHVKVDDAAPGYVTVRDRPRSRSRRRTGDETQLEVELNARSTNVFTWERRFVRGGPFVAAGGGWGSERPLRLRAGYELAFPKRVIYALAAESNTHDATVVATTQFQTGQNSTLVILPSLGVGGGVPVRVWPAARAGVRMQLDLSWWFVTFVATFDVFPPASGDRTRLVGALLGQLNF